MQTIMSTPDQRQIVLDRRMAELDYTSQMASAKKKGEFDMLATLVKKGKLSIANAAEEANMSVKEFAKKANIQLPQ